jgi:hypothetical protein
MKIKVHSLQSAHANEFGVMLCAAKSTFTIAFRRTKRAATVKAATVPTRKTRPGRAPLNPAISPDLLPRLQAILG